LSDGGVSDGPVGPPIGIGDDDNIGETRAASVKVAAEDHPVDLGCHRALELAPVPGIQSNLSHRQSLANRSSSLLSRQTPPDDLRSRSRLHIFEVVQIDDRRTEPGAAQPLERGGSVEPHEVVPI